mmetsp:Transcript_19855/g.25738  ORF Transcript_19855/g.25738 Transcript_19855/m.25738 type:complete len:353 (+) Transcript_19855:173-1231(+)
MYRRAVITNLGSDIPNGIEKILVERLDEKDGSLVLTSDDDVIVEVKAAAVNYPDLLMTCGKYQFRPPLPFVPGTEASGIVKRVGAGVKHIKAGDKVICGGRSGMMQELVKVPSSACSPLPKELTFAQGASFSVAYTTAYHCLIERANLTSFDSILINGATGGVGSAAVQLAKAIGCKTIIATGSTKSKMEIVSKLGATHTIDLTETKLEDLPNLVKGWTSGGVNVVYDPVGGEVFERSLNSTAWGARVAIVGWASSIQPSIRTNYVLIKGLTILGCRAGESVRRGFQDPKVRMKQLHEWVAQGKVCPHISHTFELEEVHEAFSTVWHRRVVGKAVVTFNRKNGQVVNSVSKI